jgi:hypothetical protein
MALTVDKFLPEPPFWRPGSNNHLLHLHDSSSAVQRFRATGKLEGEGLADGLAWSAGPYDKHCLPHPSGTLGWYL